MKTVPHRAPAAIRGTVRALRRIAPEAAAEIAYRLFDRVGAPRPVAERHLDVMRRARTLTLSDVHGPVAVYLWGPEQAVATGTVLLIHGWQGRASQFGGQVDALIDAGIRVLAFDAPAHGASAGVRTDVFEFARIASLVDAQFGPSGVIVAHSLGVLALYAALRNSDLSPSRMVSIAGPSSFDYVVGSFGRAVALSESGVERLRSRIEQRIFGTGAFWARLALAGAPAERIPQLVVHDRRDRSIAVTEAAAVADAAQSTVFLTDGAGHARVLEHPAVIKLVVDFVVGATHGEDRVDERAVLACTATRS